ATKQVGGIPVGVFVDSSAREITDCCQACEIQHIQLHGQDSGRLAKELSLDFSVTLSVGIDASGQVTSSGYKFLDQAQGTAEHLLFDYHEAGSGKQFDHTRFELPSHRSWILAGGLNAENVREAIRLLQPNGVDVSTGVESSQLGEKDPNRLRDFIKAARTL
ncbi:MAG: phosphoribosylanthranilate isomerase, partial [Chlamydiia bacterium]|nr:phosphoribosylanthranilate isomerase [Chlamydiia bacterium]